MTIFKISTSPRRTSTICGAASSLTRTFWTYLREFPALPATSTPCRRAPRSSHGSPLVTVRAPAIEAQLIETFTLLTINHQSLIATKANRIVRAARGRTVLEFGSRRAQGADARHRGCPGRLYRRLRTALPAPSPTEIYGVPAGGTMAHAWVQMFDSASMRPSRPIARLYPTQCYPAGGYLQYPEVRRAQRHPRL